MSDILSILSRLTHWQNLLDVGLVTLFFFLLRLFRGTQAVQLLRGLLVIGLVTAVLTRTFDLTAFSWLLNSSSVAILRRHSSYFSAGIATPLERVGRGMPFLNRRVDSTTTQEMINAIALRHPTSRQPGMVR